MTERDDHAPDFTEGCVHLDFRGFCKVCVARTRLSLYNLMQLSEKDVRELLVTDFDLPQP